MAYHTINNSEINYLQLIRKDFWYNMPIVNNEYLECSIIDNYKIIKPHHYLQQLWRYWEINSFDWSVWKDSGWWPLYSLTPSISKVDCIVNTGYFDTDQSKWPFQFEFEWALKWVRRNQVVLGSLTEVHVVRDEDHVSTYSTEHYNHWLQKLQTRECKEKYNRDVQYFTLKSDREKLIVFYHPGSSGVILKKLVYYLEEGHIYDGDNIDVEIGEGNYNKYFIEINEYTLNQFSDYRKILICPPESNNTHIQDNWIGETIYTTDLGKFIDQYNINLT